MKRNPAFLAAPLLAVLAAAILGACTPPSKVAEPDIVMKSEVAPNILAPCLAVKLGENFRDHRPTVDFYRGVHEITVDSQRGEKLAFVTVESDFAGGSVVQFWNGDLYWPNHITSGVWPDVMRDNWHRFEAAENACQPKPATAARAVMTKPAHAPAPKPVPVRSILKAKPLKPLTSTAPAAPSATPLGASSATPPTAAPAAPLGESSATPSTMAPTTLPAGPVATPPAGAPGDPVVLGS